MLGLWPSSAAAAKTELPYSVGQATLAIRPKPTVAPATEWSQALGSQGLTPLHRRLLLLKITSHPLNPKTL
jgi:hypothetical protein